jgi:N-acetylmuramoyl-L-alanine amidase
MSAIIPATAQDCLTLGQTVWGEARGEDWIGQVQVAHVVINRLKRNKWYGTTITEVCLKPFQFSCWNANDPNRQFLDDLTLSDCAFQLSLSAALQVIQGISIPCGVGTETHYYREGSPVPKWAIGKKRSFAIGHHLFFSDIDP